MNYSAITSCSTAKPLTITDLNRVMDEFKRRWPDADRCQRIELSPSIYAAVESRMVRVPSMMPPETLRGLPFGLNCELPDGSIREYMADGSSVLTYRSGRKIRCLKEPDDSPWSDEAILARLERSQERFIDPRRWSK